MLGLPDILYHGETVSEAVIALLNGVVTALAQEVLGCVVLGNLLVGGGILEQLVDVAVGELLDRRLDQPDDGRVGLPEFLDALVGGLDLKGVVDLLAASPAGGGFLRSRLGDPGAPGARPAAASPASAAGGSSGSGCGGILGDGDILRHGVVHFRDVDEGRKALLGHDVIGCGAGVRCAVDGGRWKRTTVVAARRDVSEVS
jgi:hypothetical protein